MARRARAEARRERSAQRRAEAAARAPQMLADEQALRNSLDSLHRRSQRMRRHVGYDRELANLTSRSTELTAQFQSELTSLTELIGRIRLARWLPPVTPEGIAANVEELCMAGRATLARLDQLVSEMLSLAETAVPLLSERADLGVVPIDREELAAGVEGLAADLERLQAGVEANRRELDDACSGAARSQGEAF